MRDDPKQNDRSEYLNTGFRDPDGREGFGDDGGTRVGRPAGESDASSARRAPRDAQQGDQSAEGQPGTNTQPVADGLEGSIQDDEGGSGPQQSRVRAATEGVNPTPEAGDERPTYNL